MGKRVADHQITKDEFDRTGGDSGDEAEAAAGSAGAAAAAAPRAAPEVLAGRRMIRLARDANGRVDLSRPAQVMNPFAKVDLRVAKAPAPVVAATTTTTTTTNTAQAPLAVGASEDTGKENSATVAEPAPESGTDAGTTAPAAAQSEPATTTTPAAPVASAATAAPIRPAGFSGFGFGAYKGFAEAFAPSGAGGSGFGAAASTAEGFGAAASTTGGFGAAAAPVSGGFGSFAGGFGVAAAAPASTEPSQSGFSFGAKPAEVPTAAAPAAASPDNDQETSPERPVTTTAAATTSSVFASEYHVSNGEEDETVLAEFRCRTHRLGAAKEASAPAASAAAGLVQAVPPSAQLGTASTAAMTAKTSDEPEKAGEDATQTEATANGATAKAAPKDWHEVGTGPLKILEDKRDAARLRLVQRRDSPPNVVLNLVLYRETTLWLQQDRFVKVSVPAPSHSDGSATETYLFKCVDAAAATRLFDTLKRLCETQAKSRFDSHKEGAPEEAGGAVDQEPRNDEDNGSDP